MATYVREHDRTSTGAEVTFSIYVVRRPYGSAIRAAPPLASELPQDVRDALLTWLGNAPAEIPPPDPTDGSSH